MTRPLLSLVLLLPLTLCQLVGECAGCQLLQLHTCPHALLYTKCKDLTHRQHTDALGAQHLRSRAARTRSWPGNAERRHCALCRRDAIRGGAPCWPRSLLPSTQWKSRGSCQPGSQPLAAGRLAQTLAPANALNHPHTVPGPMHKRGRSLNGESGPYRYGCACVIGCGSVARMVNRHDKQQLLHSAPL